MSLRFLSSPFKWAPNQKGNTFSPVLTLSLDRNVSYELAFFACPGRNQEFTVRIGDINETLDAGETSELVKIPFKALSSLTTLTFCGLGNEGFGPLIDEVTLSEASANR